MTAKILPFENPIVRGKVYLRPIRGKVYLRPMTVLFSLVSKHAMTWTKFPYKIVITKF